MSSEFDRPSPHGPDLTDPIPAQFDRPGDASSDALGAVRTLSMAIEDLHQQLESLQHAAREQDERVSRLLQHEQTLAAHATQLAQREYEVARRDAEHASATQRLAQLHLELEQTRADAQAQQAAQQALWQNERRALEAQAVELREQLASARSSAQEHAYAQTQAQSQALEAQAQESAQAQSRLTAELDRARQELAEHERHAEDARAHAARADEESRALRAQLDDACAQSQGTRAELDSARAELSAARAGFETSRAELESLRAQLTQAAQVTPAVPAEPAHDHAASLRRQRLKVLRRLLNDKAAQLQRVHEALARRSAELASAKAEPAPAAPAPAAPSSADAQRLQQLEQALSRANESLQSERARFETEHSTSAAQKKALEHALEQRTHELQEARAIRVAALAPKAPQQAPVVAPRAGKRSSLLASFAAASVGLASILASSWWLAGTLDQPVVLAAATVAIDRAGTAPSEEALASWTTFHSELLTDPRLLELASQRLKQRGYTDLGTPTDLRRRLEADLVSDNSTPGRLALTLKGTGTQRTERALETYVGALVTAANDARDRRLDQRSTIIEARAAAQAEGPQSSRTTLFAGIAGGASALALVASMLLARAQSRPRAKQDDAAFASSASGPGALAPTSWTIPVD